MTAKPNPAAAAAAEKQKQAEEKTAKALAEMAEAEDELRAAVKSAGAAAMDSGLLSGHEVANVLRPIAQYFDNLKG